MRGERTVDGEEKEGESEEEEGVIKGMGGRGRRSGEGKVGGR